MGSTSSSLAVASKPLKLPIELIRQILEYYILDLTTLPPLPAVFHRYPILTRKEVTRLTDERAAAFELARIATRSQCFGLAFTASFMVSEVFRACQLASNEYECMKKGKHRKDRL